MMNAQRRFVDLSATLDSAPYTDPPWHYASTTDGGKRAWGIDELPLEWCLRPGVKLDFRELPDGYVVTASAVVDALESIEHELQSRDIVIDQYASWVLIRAA